MLTEDAAAPHQTPMWECSGHLLAGMCHYIAEYTSFLLFTVHLFTCSTCFTCFTDFTCSSFLPGWSTAELRASSLQKELWVENQSKRQHTSSSKQGAEKPTQPTNHPPNQLLMKDKTFKDHPHRQYKLLVSTLGQQNGNTSIAGCCFRQEE